MARKSHILNVFYVVTFILKLYTVVSPSLSVFGVSIFIVSSVSAGIIYDTTSEGTFTQEIKIKQGKLVGQSHQLRSLPGLKTVEVYLGIPYAAPPTGSQRFMPPGSPPQWREVKVANTFGPVCPQNLPDLNKRTKNAVSEGRANYLRRLFPYLLHNQSEDCLYLNIYAPAQKRVSGRSVPKYPVIVFIHGESFEWNSGNPYDGSVLAGYGEVVVVTLNFRLGILGFLRPGVGDHTVSNFGLLDQIAALQWIKENIQEFGGDPGSVTLMGHGTGAACVNYLMVSPVSQGTDGSGLFHRAILMSGTALADWALTSSSVVAIQVSHALNCPLSETNNEMASCLRKRRLDEIMDVKVVVPEFKTRFGPMVDGSVVPNDPFHLTGVYKDLFSRYELLYGVTELESYDLLDADSLQHGMMEQKRDRTIRTYVRERFEYEPGLILAETLKAYNVTSRRSSVSSQSVAETHRDILLDILSDARFAAPMVQTANFHSSANPRSYFYVFSHKSVYGDYATVKIQKSIHGEELPYVFGVPFDSVKFPSHHHFSEMERLLSKAVMTFWTNFAKTGNPNAPRTERDWMNEERYWPKYDVFNQSYQSLGIPLKVGQYYRRKVLDYWINYGWNLSVNYIGFLRDEKGCIHPNDTAFMAIEEADTGTTKSLPKILLIVFGICLLLINLCAYGALYNQRRKLRAQEMFIRNFYSEVEITNSKVMCVEHTSGTHEPENLTALGTVRKKCSNAEILRRNCEGQYDSVRKGAAENIKRDHSESMRWKISKQCSASTMDTNTKVRRWIECELNERFSPELQILKPTPFEEADQKYVPTRQESSKTNFPADDPSQVLLIPIIHQEQNPSCSTTCKQISTIRSVPRKVAKKVSVGVDATPSARIASMLCRNVEDTSGDASILSSQGALCPKEAVALGPECCDVNSTLVSPVVSQGQTSNCRHFENFHSEKNAVSQANPLVTDVKNLSSHSRSVTHHNTSKAESSYVTNKAVNESKMEVCPKKIKLHGTKKDVGINTIPMESVLEIMEKTKYVTLKDTAAHTNEILRVVNCLKNSCRRNGNEVVVSERNVVNKHEEHIRCGEGVTLVNTVAPRRFSVPLHISRRPSKQRQSAITKRINRDNKRTCLSRRGNPSTVGRPKPNTAALLGTLQDSFEATSCTAALPTGGTAGYPSAFTLLHQEPNNTQSSEGIVEEQVVDRQNQLRQGLLSASVSPTKLQATEAETKKLPLPIVAFCKKRAPAKVSVGTSTNSLIQSEGKK